MKSKRCEAIVENPMHMRDGNEDQDKADEYDIVRNLISTLHAKR